VAGPFVLVPLQTLLGLATTLRVNAQDSHYVRALAPVG